MLKVGDTLGSNKIVQVLLGGMGIVYVLDNGIVAKSLRDEYLSNTSVVTAFRNEAQFLVLCDEHPNIVECHGVQTINNQLYLFLDYISKGNLRQNIFLDGISPMQAAIWSVHLCFAMVHMHQMGGMVHRDIKPENLLIDSNGTLKLSDFGLIAVLDSITAKQSEIAKLATIDNTVFSSEYQRRASVVAGTPLYMAPEQFSGIYTERTDIYSFGIVLYEMLTGVFPKDHRQGNVKPPSNTKPRVPVIFDHIIANMIAIKSENRYPTFKDLFVDLAQITQGAAGEYNIIGNIDTSNIKTLTKHPQFMCLPYSRSEPINRLYGLYELGKFSDALKFIDSILLNMDVRMWHYDNSVKDASVTTASTEMQPEAKNSKDFVHNQTLWWLNERAWCLGELGLFQESLVSCEKVLSIDPCNEAALVNMGVCLARLARHLEAIPIFKKTLQLHPSSRGALMNLAVCLAEIGRLEDATSYFDLLEQLYADDPQVKDLRKTLNIQQETKRLMQDGYTDLNRRAYFFQQNNLFSEALLLCEIILSSNPDDIDALINKGICFSMQDKKLDAILVYRRVLELAPTKIEIWYNLGLDYLSVGDIDKATECYKAMLNISPHESRAATLMQMISKAIFKRSLAAVDSSLAKGVIRADDQFTMGS